MPKELSVENKLWEFQYFLWNRYRTLKIEREKSLWSRSVFVLEHGLETGDDHKFSSEETFDLSKELEVYLEKYTVPDKKHYLCWLVFATELGYKFDGQSYWTEFNQQTRSWNATENTKKLWITDKFILFSKFYGGYKPTGVWATHFSNICWPVGNAILPMDIQGKLASCLADFSRSTGDLGNVTQQRIVEWIRNWGKGENQRWRDFASAGELPGLIAIELLGLAQGNPSEGICREAIHRIKSDLEKSQRASDDLDLATQKVKEAIRRGSNRSTARLGGPGEEHQPLPPVVKITTQPVVEPTVTSAVSETHAPVDQSAETILNSSVAIPEQLHQSWRPDVQISAQPVVETPVTSTVPEFPALVDQPAETILDGRAVISGQLHESLRSEIQFSEQPVVETPATSTVPEFPALVDQSAETILDGSAVISGQLHESLRTEIQFSEQLVVETPATSTPPEVPAPVDQFAETILDSTAVISERPHESWRPLVQGKVIPVPETASPKTKIGVTGIGGSSSTGTSDKKQSSRPPQDLDLRPELVLLNSPDNGDSWTPCLKIPDLSMIAKKHPNLLSKLNSSRSSVRGDKKGRPYAARYFWGSDQLVELSYWPDGPEPLLKLENTSAEEDAQIARICHLSPRERWLFQVRESYAYPVGGVQYVTPGETYLLVEAIKGDRSYTDETTMISQITLNCSGYYAYRIELNSTLGKDQLATLSLLGLAPKGSVQISPVGLSPLPFTKATGGEWLTGDEACFRIQSDIQLVEISISLHNPDISDWPGYSLNIPPTLTDTPVYVSLPQLPAGEYQLTVQACSAAGDKTTKSLGMKVREPDPWLPETTPKPIIRVSIGMDASDCSLDEFLRSGVPLTLRGPSGHIISATLTFCNRRGAAFTSLEIPSLQLPLSSSLLYERIREHIRNAGTPIETLRKASKAELRFFTHEHGNLTDPITFYSGAAGTEFRVRLASPFVRLEDLTGAGNFPSLEGPYGDDVFLTVKVLDSVGMERHSSELPSLPLPVTSDELEGHFDDHFLNNIAKDDPQSWAQIGLSFFAPGLVPDQIKLNFPRERYFWNLEKNEDWWGLSASDAYGAAATFMELYSFETPFKNCLPDTVVDSLTLPTVGGLVIAEVSNRRQGIIIAPQCFTQSVPPDPDQHRTSEISHRDIYTQSIKLARIFKYWLNAPLEPDSVELKTKCVNAMRIVAEEILHLLLQESDGVVSKSVVHPHIYQSRALVSSLPPKGRAKWMYERHGDHIFIISRYENIFSNSPADTQSDFGRPLWVIEFALRLACNPESARDWANQWSHRVPTEGFIWALERLKLIPELVRAARDMVLTVHDFQPTKTLLPPGHIYRGWEWL